jgi:hypothetical protein
MKRWIPCELHTHTKNSDGNYTLLELVNKAKVIGLECIALTDHNTISGYPQITDEVIKTGIQIIRGIEWTTFYGHMVVLGAKKYVDWRTAGPADINKSIAEIHEAGGLAGIAHPYEFGSPICTGGNWQFEISDWNDIDYLEVWSEVFPSINQKNKRAFALWTDLLNKGFKITAVSGRDWHSDRNNDDPIAVTYLGVTEDKTSGFQTAALKAISNGSSSVTMGPLVTMDARLKSNGSKFGIGEEINLKHNSDTVEINVRLDMSARKDFWNHNIEPETIVINTNDGIKAEIAASNSLEKPILINAKETGWIRAELYGKAKGISTMIAFTNPIYICE